MFTPHIIRKGETLWDDVAVTHMDGSWCADAAYDQRVSELWQQKIDNAASLSQTLWDGTYYRLANFAEWSGPAVAPVLQLGTVSYRYIATFHALHADHAAGGVEPLHHLATAGLIHTADGAVIFGRRARGGAIDLIGGGVQPDEPIVNGGADLRRNLLKELREEVGIAENDVEGIRGLGIMMSSTSNVLILSEIRTRLSRAEATSRFAARDEDEMAEPVFVA